MPISEQRVINEIVTVGSFAIVIAGTLCAIVCAIWSWFKAIDYLALLFTAVRTFKNYLCYRHEFASWMATKKTAENEGAKHSA